MPTPNVATLALKAPYGVATTSRTLADHLGDVLNVKSFGAVGNGTGDDRAAIQACFDAAFTNSGTPHGVTNSTQNRAVFFPPGNYPIGGALTLTDVYGGHIFGSGRYATIVTSAGSGANCLTVNGMSHTAIENIALVSANAAGCIGLDLDWGGSGSVGLSDNIFLDVDITGYASGVRIAHSNNEGHNNQFLHCEIGAYSSSVSIGILCEGTDAMNQHICGGGNASQMLTAVKCTGGSVHAIGYAGAITTNEDYYFSSGNPCTVVGCRTESANFLTGLNGTAYIVGLSHTHDGVLADLTNFKLVMDASESGQAPGGVAGLRGGTLVGDASSKLYARGSIFWRIVDPGDFYTSFSGDHTNVI